MIDKPTIIITSIGRTGTEFFARLFADIVPDSTSLHEPDIVQNPGVQNKWYHYLRQVHRAGVWRMVILKSLGKWTLVNLSDSRLLSRIDNEKAARALLDHRKSFVNEMPGSVYIESNIGYYGLVDIVPRVFRQPRVVYLIRDGRDWVRSHYNWGEAYNKRGFMKLIAHNWPSASSMPRDAYAEEWSKFTRFDKLCWAWTRLNEYAIRTMPGNPQTRVFQFERIFAHEERYQYLDELVAFSTSLSGIDQTRLGKTEGRLERKTHQSSTDFPGWRDWSRAQKRQFEKICGPLMEKLGYDL